LARTFVIAAHSSIRHWTGSPKPRSGWCFTYVKKAGANVALGFAPDERDFDIAAKALKTLGVTKVRLITNNPDKVEALRRAGIETERVTAWTVERPENSAYLAAKRAKMGHIL
jgi:GTP cyclohydrolase II